MVNSILTQATALSGMWDAGGRPREFNAIEKLQASLFGGHEGGGLRTFAV